MYYSIPICTSLYVKDNTVNTLPTIKVTLAGAPRVGKTTLLHCFAKYAPNSNLTTQVDETKRIVHLNTSLTHVHIHFMTAQGPFWGIEAVAPALFTNTRVVLFVISASQGKEQQRPLEQYVSHATHVGADWNNIPWFFVLNKIDLYKRNPLHSHIPPHCRNDIVRCVATECIGVEQIWQKIVNVVSSMR